MIRIACVLLIGSLVAGCSNRGTAPKEPAQKSSGQSSIQKQTPHSAAANDTGTAEILTTFRFEELGSESGFVFRRYDDMQGQHRILEVNGGGVALFDLDADGWLDIFMTNGCRLPLSTDPRATPGKLFRNLRHEKFQDISEASSLVQFGFCYGCAAADMNEDGFEDLYLTAIGGNQFWLNNGDGTFSEIASQNGSRTNRWGSSAAFADLNGDQNLDLYVANYLLESDVTPRLCPDPDSPDGYTGCSPAVFQGVPDVLLLSDGAGSYVDASESAGLNALPGKALGVVICDLGGDERPEIYVANDGEPNYLLTVKPQDQSLHGVRSVRLMDRAIDASAALSESGYGQASMGIAAADFDRNGRIDLFLTHFFGDTNTLYMNHSSGKTLLFEDATRTSQLGPPSRSKLGFGVAAIDVDNNGWTDLVVANGHVDDRTWMKASQPFRMTAQIFENQAKAVFEDVSLEAGPYFAKPTLGRGLALGDLNRDDRLDLVISQQLDPSAILVNRTPPKGESLSLKLIGRNCPRTPVGAKVRLAGTEPPQEQQLLGGGSFQTASANEIHISGLTEGGQDVEILWPDGNRELLSLDPGQWIIVQKMVSAVRTK